MVAIEIGTVSATSGLWGGYLIAIGIKSLVSGRD